MTETRNIKQGKERKQGEEKQGEEKERDNREEKKGRKEGNKEKAEEGEEKGRETEKRQKKRNDPNQLQHIFDSGSRLLVFCFRFMEWMNTAMLISLF